MVRTMFTAIWLVSTSRQVWGLVSDSCGLYWLRIQGLLSTFGTSSWAYGLAFRVRFHVPPEVKRKVKFVVCYIMLHYMILYHICDHVISYYILFYCIIYICGESMTACSGLPNFGGCALPGL